MSRSGLGPATGSLVALSAAIAVGDEERVASTLAEAEEAAGPIPVEEAVLQSYLFVGFPAALNALTLWRARHPAIVTPSEEPDVVAWRKRGEAVCRTVYSTAYRALRENVAALHPDLEGWMLAEGYGKVLGRPGLDLRTRELCIVGLLAAQNAPRQLHSHLRGALNAGAPPESVAEALEVALGEVAAAAVPDREERALAHRRVWMRVRERHESKDSNDLDPGGEAR